MAKKRAGTRSKKKTAAGRSRPAARRKTSPSSRRKPVLRVPLDRASDATRAAVLREFKRVLAGHGIVGELVEIRFEPPGQPAAGGLGFVTPCPPNHVRRTVCVLQPDGSLKCVQKCEPVV
jgi:hypothetical protein